jgi:hypothetical protein
VDQQSSLVVFFRVTSSYHHPVSAEGLHIVLQKLSRSNSDIVNYDRILLFVVPDTQTKIMSTSFTKQPIEGNQAPILPDAQKGVLFKDVYNDRENRGILAGFGKKSYEDVVKAVGLDENEITLEVVHSKMNGVKSRNCCTSSSFRFLTSHIAMN